MRDYAYAVGAEDKVELESGIGDIKWVYVTYEIWHHASSERRKIVGHRSVLD